MHTSLKRWHVGGPIHASLESLIALRGRHGLTPENVARITARVPTRDGVIVRDRNAPNVNFQHVLAVALIDGGMSLAATYDAARMHDPQVRAVAGRIEMVLDDALQALMPNRTAIVEVRTTDGRHLTHRTDAVPGSPGRADDAGADRGRRARADRARARLATDGAADRRRAGSRAVADVRSLRPLLRLS